MRRYKTPVWEGIAWALFFISALVGITWAEIALPKTHKVDCKPVVAKFETIIGEAVLANGYQETKDANSYAKEASKIVLYSPVCFPQAIIDQAQQTLGL